MSEAELAVRAETDVAGTVALITGADRNLGKSMALSLLEAGGSVVMTSLSRAELEAVLDEASEAARDRALVIEADISREDERDGIVRRAVERFGRVDMVVNNAAVTPETYWPDWLVEGEPNQWTLDTKFYRHFLEVDSVAPHGFIAALVPGMLERGWGRIVNVTTSLDTMLRFWPYGSAKAALEAQTAVLAGQLEGSGVTANVLIPGGFSKPSELRLKNGHVVTPEFTPAIMATPIRWLASNASAHVSGRRIIASRWNEGDVTAAGGAAAIFPIAWSEYGERAVNPGISRQS